VKLVAILTLIISLESLGLDLRLTLTEPWKSEPLEPSPSVVVPPSTPQPTLTECEVLAQQIVDAETELAVFWLDEKAQVAGCSTRQPPVRQESPGQGYPSENERKSKEAFEKNERTRKLKEADWCLNRPRAVNYRDNHPEML